jgi:hypothetical protein
MTDEEKKKEEECPSSNSFRTPVHRGEIRKDCKLPERPFMMKSGEVAGPLFDIRHVVKFKTHKRP